MNLVEAIRGAIEKHRLIPRGASVVAGVSGGADSVALLRILHEIGVPLTVAHLNHRLRGTESDSDETFVRNLADEQGLPLVAKAVDVESMAQSEGLSIEMAARRARHEFFAEFDGAAIALAHHADDQVETFLLKLARGASPEGLCGMAYAQQLGPLRLVRPMLDIPRSAILDWLKSNGFEWREDASNADGTYLRNRVRHTILPLLEQELNSNIRTTILRTMNILREENGWMEASIADCRLPTADLPLAMRRRVLRNWLFEQGATDVDFNAIERILALMDKTDGTSIHEINARQRVVVEYGRPRFEDLDDHFAAAPSWKLTVEPGRGWRRDHGKGAGNLPAEASFDADRINDAPIEVRPVMPGDRINPWGMEGSRKLQDILTDQKIPKAERSRIPVVVCRGTVIWVPGYRIDRDWAVPRPDASSVHVRIEPVANRPEASSN